MGDHFEVRGTQNINTVGILEIRETIDYSANHGGEKCDGNSSDDLVGATASYSSNGLVGVDGFVVGL